MVALTTGALGLIAGATPATASLLTVAMAGFQASIGAVNDLADREPDALGQPWKPLPAGHVGVGPARLVAVVTGMVGLLASLLLGLPALLVGALGYGLGLLYDLVGKRRGWGWLCFALALPLVPLYAWLGAGAGLPPMAGLLVVAAVLAGIQLAIANSLVDFDADVAAGAPGLAARLGPGQARRGMWASAAGVVVLAWLSLAMATTRLTSAGGPPSMAIIVVVAGATVVIVAGLVLSSRSDARSAWLGWHVQAVGVALLGVAWLVNAATPGGAA